MGSNPNVENGLSIMKEQRWQIWENELNFVCLQPGWSNFGKNSTIFSKRGPKSGHDRFLLKIAQFFLKKTKNFANILDHQDL